MTGALEGGEWSAARPGRTLPPGKTRSPLYGRLGGPQGRSGRAEDLVPTGIRSRIVQPVVSSYTDWATGPTDSEGSDYNTGWTTALDYRREFPLRRLIVTGSGPTLSVPTDLTSTVDRLWLVASRHLHLVPRERLRGSVPSVLSRIFVK